ncbi:MAG: PcfB family protein [Lachnospiraceae bacterium]|nr:PcfB family protein [Lachnospiraceae bacterium]
MEEEVTQKTIMLSIKATKLTAEVLRNALKKYLAAQQKKGPNPYKKGKQSYRELRKQNVELSHIEINDSNIRSFERVAREFKIDYSLKKDTMEKPPKYLVFFKGRDTDTMNLAFKKYVGKQMQKKQQPSIRRKLAYFKEIVAKGKNRERAREHQQDRGQSL